MIRLAAIIPGVTVLCVGASLCACNAASTLQTNLQTLTQPPADPLPLESALYAFPGAEGYGRDTAGGRGGVVYEVTTLEDAGPGSLRAAVEATGPRTIVFRVSGTIGLRSTLRISRPFITIAGQTAPGDGIALRNFPLVIAADEVVIRHIRVRLGDESGEDADAISGRYVKNVILDHVSASWSVDETVSLYHCENLTLQWSFITESLYESNHVKGNHGFGGIWGGNRSSYHHNLFAHHSNRNPRFASGSGSTDFRNNVIFNWGYKATYGGEAQQATDARFPVSTINVVANYYKPGPATKPGKASYQVFNPWSRGSSAGHGKWHLSGNVVEHNQSVSVDNWLGAVFNDGESIPEPLKLDQPWPALPISQQLASDALAAVLAAGGATRPWRDAVDARIVAEVRGGYATFEGARYETEHEVADKSRPSGIIDSQRDVGGWPALESAPAPQDTDHDGMPDAWEARYGLNAHDPADRNRVAVDGYTMLEKYLNSID